MRVRVVDKAGYVVVAGFDIGHAPSVGDHMRLSDGLEGQVLQLTWLIGNEYTRPSDPELEIKVKFPQS